MLDVRYPIGPAPELQTLTPQGRAALLLDLTGLPAMLRDAVDELPDAQLDTPYRPGGWTVRQVVHHVPDSHLNAYVRMKLALTEENPIIRPYDEVRWAELPDALLPVEVSLRLLDALHERWVGLLSQFILDDARWARRFVHPELGRAFSLDGALALYAWHGRHHLAHITRPREQKGD